MTSEPNDQKRAELMNCPSKITIGGQISDSITVQCEQIVSEDNPLHERTHSATIVAMSTLTIDGEPRSVSVNVYLVW